MIIEKIEENQKKYSIIYADPPWQKKKGGLRKSRPNQSRDLDYKTLTIEEIKNILSSIQTEEKHNFFIWSIDEFLFDSNPRFRTDKAVNNPAYKRCAQSDLSVKYNPRRHYEGWTRRFRASYSNAQRREKEATRLATLR